MNVLKSTNKIWVIIFLLLCDIGSGFTSHAQGLSEGAFDHYELSTKKLKAFTIHVTKSDDKTPKPLLIYIDGSGNYPIKFRTKSGRYSTSIALDVMKYTKDYRIVLISKPGIPFTDSLQYTASGRAFYPSNKNYDELYSLDWRAGAASKAIDFLTGKLNIDNKKIIVMGYSEGAQVAPCVAVLNKKVTHVVSFVGNAMNQLYDFILDARLQVDRGKISADSGQQIVDSLYKEYEKIYAHPKATDEKWYGETYLKWSSFTSVTPLENMLKLNIPILYVAGGKDNHQNIMDMDYAKLEFLRKGKKNLTYKVYPDSDHYFQESITVDGKSKKIDRGDEVHQFALDWVNSIQ